MSEVFSHATLEIMGFTFEAEVCCAYSVWHGDPKWTITDIFIRVDEPNNLGPWHEVKNDTYQFNYLSELKAIVAAAEHAMHEEMLTRRWQRRRAF